MLVLVIVSLVFIVPGSMMSIDEEEVILNVDAQSVINRHNPDDDVNYTIVSQRALVDFDGAEYTYYKLAPSGYVILFDETNSLMEGCYDYELYPVAKYSSEVLYYGGPGVLCAQEDNQFVNIINGSICDASAVYEIKNVQASVKNESIQALKNKNLQIGIQNSSIPTSLQNETTVEYSAGEEYFSELTDFGSNRKGTCTVLAAAILLGYYEEVEGDEFNGYAGTNHVTSNGGTTELFHQYLNNYVYGFEPQGGIFMADASIGFNHYLADQGLSKSFEVFSTKSIAIQKVEETLSGGSPIAVSIGTNHGASMNHSLIAYKIEYDSLGSATLTCHVGWHYPNPDLGVNDVCRFTFPITWVYNSMRIGNSTTVHNLVYTPSGDVEDAHWYRCTNTMCDGYEYHYVRLQHVQDNIFEYTTNHNWNYVTLHGVQHYRGCSGCSYSRQENHTWGEWTITANSHVRFCTGCLYRFSEGHTVASYQSINATQHEGYCTVCMNDIARNHTMEETATGLRCSVCSYSVEIN